MVFKKKKEEWDKGVKKEGWKKERRSRERGRSGGKGREGRKEGRK